MKRDDLLDLNEALQHPGKKVAVDLSTELPEEEDIDLVEPVEGFLECVSTGNMLLVTGEFTKKCVLECSRCSEPIEVDLAYSMDEQFPVEGVPSGWSNEGHAKVVEEEDYPLFDNNSLMVERLVRQGLLVNLPMQVLCEHGWTGECPCAMAREVVGHESSSPPAPEVKRGLKVLSDLQLPEEKS